LKVWRAKVGFKNNSGRRQQGNQVNRATKANPGRGNLNKRSREIIYQRFGKDVEKEIGESGAKHAECKGRRQGEKNLIESEKLQGTRRRRTYR